MATPEASQPRGGICSCQGSPGFRSRSVADKGARTSSSFPVEGNNQKGDPFADLYSEHGAAWTNRHAQSGEGRGGGWGGRGVELPSIHLLNHKKIRFPNSPLPWFASCEDKVVVAPLHFSICIPNSKGTAHPHLNTFGL